MARFTAEDGLELLDDIGAEIKGLESQLATLYGKRNLLFGRLRALDVSWETISDACGVSKQAAIRAWQRAKPAA